MTLAIDVSTRGPNGITVARTTIMIDGSVITALRPELLRSLDDVDRHLAEVGKRIRQWQRRIHLVQRTLAVGSRVAVAAMVATGLTSAGHALTGALAEAAGWAAGMLGGALVRWLVPVLLRRLARRRLGFSQQRLLALEEPG